MSSSQEQEKLTPASRKSYDGYMAEDVIEHEAAREAKNEAAEDHAHEEGDESDRKQAAREISEARINVAKLIRSLLTTEMKADDTKEAAGAVVKFITAEKDQGLKQQNKAKKEVANLILMFTPPEQSVQNSAEKEGNTANEQSDIVEALYEAAEEQGMDTGEIEQIVEDEKDKQLPLQENARFNHIEAYFETKVEEASEEALTDLKTDLTALKTSDIEVKKTVDKTGTLLEDIIEHVEQQDDKATSEEELDHRLAEVIVSFFGSVSETAAEAKVVSESAAAIEKRQKEAELMMNVLLSPHDSIENRQQMISALLHDHYPLEGKNAQQNEQLREVILRQAELAGLDRKAIEEGEKFVEMTAGVKPEVVEGLEHLPDLSAFERQVEKQIMDATPDQVVDIQKAWKEVLANAEPGSLVAIDAQKAIDVLGDIIEFKREVISARARGGRVDPRNLATPKFFHGDENDLGEEEVTEKQKDEARDKLVQAFLTMFASATSEDRQIVEAITLSVLAAEGNYDLQVKRINILLAGIPQQSQSDPDRAAYLSGEVRRVALRQGINLLDISHEQSHAQAGEESQTALENLFTETVAGEAGLKNVQNVWDTISEDTGVRTPMKEHVEDAVEQIETIVTTNQDTSDDKSREQVIEKEVTETNKFAKAMNNFFSPENAGELDAEAIDMLVVVTAAPYRREAEAIEQKTAEKEIAQLLLAFPVNEESGRAAVVASDIRQEILSYAEKIGLDTQAIFLEHARLQETTPAGHQSDPLEEVLKRSIGNANAWEIRNIQKLWQKVIKNTDDAGRKEQLEKAVKPLGKISKAKESITKAAPADPSVLFENTIDGQLPEKIEPTGKSNQQEDKDAIVEQSKAVNEMKSFEDVTVAKLQNYTEKLKGVLSEKGALSEEQLMSAYVALMTQVTVLRNETERKGESLGFATLQKETLPVMSQLLTQLREANRDKFADYMGEMRINLSERENQYREWSGFTEEMKVKNMADSSGGSLNGNGDYIPDEDEIIQNPANARYLESVRPGGAVVKLANFDSDGVQLPQGTPAEMEQAIRTEIASVNDPEVYQSYKRLGELQLTIQNLEKEIMNRNRNEDGSPNFQGMEDLRELVLLANEQREQILASRVGFDGILEESAEIDQKLYGGEIHTALGERMRRLKVAFGDWDGRSGESYSDEQLLEYYKELQVWTTTILDNDVRRNPGKEGKKDMLKLDQSRYDGFLKIANPDQPIDITNIRERELEIRDNIDYLLRRDDQGGDFLKYFMHAPQAKKYDKNNLGRAYTVENNFNPDNSIGIPYQRPSEVGGMGDTPRTLKDTMAIIAEQFSNEDMGYDFSPGGNRELIDVQGNFHYNNFIYWIRLKINEDVDYNNDAEISPFGKIIIKLPMTQISMFELLLLIPEFTAQRKFEIKDKEWGPSGRWGAKTEHPDFNWAQLDFIGQEMEFRQMTHKFRTQFTDTGIANDKDKFLQLMQELHHSNNWTRSSNIFRVLGYPSSVTNGGSTQEVDDWFSDTKEKQGSIGKSMCDMIVSYYYLSELTDYYQTAEVDLDGNVVKVKDKEGNMKVKKRDKNFNENMFYRFLEPDGANRFLVNMAEGALKQNEDAKVCYLGFIQKRIQAAAEEYAAKAGLSEDQRKSIRQQAEERQSNLEELKMMDKAARDKNIAADISFTKSAALRDFHRYVRRSVLTDSSEQYKSDAEIILDVRNELLNNLRGEYFTDLVEMNVKELDKKVEVEIDGVRSPKDAERSSTSNTYRTTGAEVRFGDIVLRKEDKEKGISKQTMEDFLLGDKNGKGGFRPEQILKFDYTTNNQDDPTWHSSRDQTPGKYEIGFNPFAGIDDPDDLRRKIDEFMDPNHKEGMKNHELFKNNEKMMLAFMKYIALIPRREINHFRDAPENVTSRDLIKAAFRNCVEKAHGIDGVESEYGWWWVRDYVYLWGIGAALDCDGIGFRQDGKLIGTGRWRPRREAKDRGGNEETYDEFLAFSLPFLHHLRVQNIMEHEPLGHRSVFYHLQGGEGYEVTPRAVREFAPRSHYKFKQNAEYLYQGNNLTSASNLLELISKTEFDFTNILSFDVLGNVVFDYSKARDLFGKWRSAIRYTFGKNELDYREKIWSEGREKTLYEHFFGPKTRALNELITRQVHKHDEDRMYKEPFDAFMLSVVAAEVYEHRKMFTSGHHWSIQNIIELENFLLQYMTESKLKEDEEDGHKKVDHHIEPLLTHAIFTAALRAYDTGYSKMYASELGTTLGTGILLGLAAGIKEYIQKSKWIY